MAHRMIMLQPQFFDWLEENGEKELAASIEAKQLEFMDVQRKKALARRPIEHLEAQKAELEAAIAEAKKE